MAIYLVLAHTACLLCAVFDLRIFPYGSASMPIMDQDTIRQPAAITCIVFGWHQRLVLSYQILPHLILLTLAQRIHESILYLYLCIYNTRSYAALRPADIDWIVGLGYNWGGYILGCSQRLALCLRTQLGLARGNN